MGSVREEEGRGLGWLLSRSWAEWRPREEMQAGEALLLGFGIEGNGTGPSRLN